MSVFVPAVESEGMLRKIAETAPATSDAQWRPALQLDWFSVRNTIMLRDPAGWVAVGTVVSPVGSKYQMGMDMADRGIPPTEAAIDNAIRSNLDRPEWRIKR